MRPNEFLGLSHGFHALAFLALGVEGSCTLQRRIGLPRLVGFGTRSGGALLRSGRLALGLTTNVFGRRRLSLTLLPYNCRRRVLLGRVCRRLCLSSSPDGWP